MMTWAALDFTKDEDSQLTLKVVEGTIVAIDLDNFSEVVRSRGWSSYKPNPATGLLTSLVLELVEKYMGFVVYGLDWDRGTEEVLIEMPYVEPRELVSDLRKIVLELKNLGVSTSIVAIKDYVICKRADSRRIAYNSTPGRKRAVRILKYLKRRGGEAMYIDGELIAVK